MVKPSPRLPFPADKKGREAGRKVFFWGVSEPRTKEASFCRGENDCLRSVGICGLLCGEYISQTFGVCIYLLKY